MAILDWFKREPNIQLLEKLHTAGVWPVELEERQKSEKQAILADKTFVITGTLEGYSRDEIKEMIQELGGKVTDSVSQNTSYLLVGEQPGSKLEKAETWGKILICRI
jgi:DNA ligase (NAD+)